ncbi:hypothetical protein GYMLUDRAFT_240796 [Collybiopsis luxurians FD-317 M1]|nr:hypothetical protein GYMLUDRAFT_240796 [Collybiopsis luxurians FD-317 M1]
MSLALLSAVAVLPSIATAQNNLIYVRSLAQEPIQAFFTLPDTFSGLNPWHRTGWELIAFRDQDDPDSRVGFYYDFAANKTWVTLTTFDNVTFTNFDPETNFVN